MKKLLCFLVLVIPLFVMAQQEKGIKFEQNLSWEQVKAKAKSENKYIFIDCYATWCAPCKYMDKEVYPKDTVGDYMNAKFISIKVQMDSTAKDNEEIKKWYTDANNIRKQYKVTGLPTFLYFSPEGKLVHKGAGSYKYTDFLGLSTNAANPEKQYYTLLENYQQGKKEYDKMAYLAGKAKSLDDKEIADKISKDYMNNYLFKLPEDQLFTKDNIDFIGSFIQGSKDKGFKLFYKYTGKIDSLMGRKNYARNVVNVIIDKEYVQPVLIKAVNSKNSSPDWNKIAGKIRKKFSDDYAVRIVMKAQEIYYFNGQDWANLCKIYIKRYRKYGISSLETDNGVGSVDGVNNNMAFKGVFEKSNDKETINVAIEWMDSIIKNRVYENRFYEWFLDTYANLLYKGGRSEEALKFEKKALTIAQEKHNKNKDEFYIVEMKSLQAVISKMEKGESTWPKE